MCKGSRDILSSEKYSANLLNTLFVVVVLLLCLLISYWSATIWILTRRSMLCSLWPRFIKVIECSAYHYFPIYYLISHICSPNLRHRRPWEVRMEWVPPQTDLSLQPRPRASCPATAAQDNTGPVNPHFTWRDALLLQRNKPLQLDNAIPLS